MQLVWVWFHRDTLTLEMGHLSTFFQIKLSMCIAPILPDWNILSITAGGPANPGEALGVVCGSKNLRKSCRYAHSPSLCSSVKPDGSAEATGKRWSPRPLYEDWVGLKLLIFSERQPSLHPFPVKIEIKFSKLVSHSYGGGAILRCLQRAHRPSLPAWQVLGASRAGTAVLTTSLPLPPKLWRHRVPGKSLPLSKTPQRLAFTFTDSFLTTRSWREYWRTNLGDKSFAVPIFPISSDSGSTVTRANLSSPQKEFLPGVSRVPHTSWALLGPALSGPGPQGLVCIPVADTAGEVQGGTPDPFSLIACTNDSCALTLLANISSPFTDMWVLSQICWFC